MKIARRPLTQKEEIDGQIGWFVDLRDELERGNIEAALAAIDGYLKLLSSQRSGNGDRTKPE